MVSVPCITDTDPIGRYHCISIDTDTGIGPPLVKRDTGGDEKQLIKFTWPNFGASPLQCMHLGIIFVLLCVPFLSPPPIDC